MRSVQIDMFIKVTNYHNQEIIVNTENVTFITPFEKADGTQSCYINFTSGDMLSVKQSIPTLECLIEVDSLEKKIDSIKDENARIKLREAYDIALRSFM